MRALEAAAFAAGVPEATLQEQAGAAVAEEVGALLRPGQVVVVLAGHGNNGRDGAVAARHLAEGGAAVQLFLGPRHAVRDAETETLAGLGVRLGRLEDAPTLEDALRRAAVAVDALVGVGAHGPLREPLAASARLLNRVSWERGTALQVVAVDIPSGIDPDSGAVPGEAVWADGTVTLGAVKAGLLQFPAAARVGRLLPRTIDLPPAAVDPLPYGVVDLRSLADRVPPRPLDAHKYRFGRVLVVAGARHFLGAPALCAAAAARAGAGLVTVASPPDVRQVVAAHVPEATYVPRDLDVEADPDGAVAALKSSLRSTDALVVGPGLGRSEAAVRFVRGLLEQRAAVAPPHSALVLDADGLFALDGWPRWWQHLGPQPVLTPHSGELARLAGAPAAERPAWEHAGRLAAEWGLVLVAKGPFTAVAAPDGRVEVWPRANPALASGGTGDVLAGLCGGLLAQGAAPWDAARLGVAVHGLAAADLVERRGWRTLLAGDLPAAIPAQLARVAGPNWTRPSRA